MEEDFYVPGFTNSLMSGEQSLPTAQPVQTAAYTEDEPRVRPRDLLASDLMMSPRDIAAVPMANAGVVSPFTTNPYMVVNYGEETNTPSFANTQVLDPTQAYRFVDQRTGDVVTSDPNDPTSLARLVQQANQLSGNAATKANWDIYSGTEGDTSVASDRPNYLGGVLGALVQYGLPIGLSLIPGVGWAGSAALAGAGSTAGKLISGYDLGDALKAGLITAATAGLLKAPILEGGGSLSGALSNAVGLSNAPTSAFDKAFDADYASWLASGADVAAPAVSGAASGVGGGVGGSFAGSDAGGNFIQVLGGKGASNIPSSFLTGALGAASGTLSGTNYGNQVWDRPAAQEAEVQEPGESEFNPEEGITVFANKYNIPFDPTSILNTFLSGNYTGTPDYGGYKDLINKYREMYDIQGPPEEAPEGYDEGWDVLAPRENPTVGSGLINLPDLFPPLNSVDIPTDLVKEWPEVPPGDNEIVVEGYPPRADNLLPDIFPPLNSVDIPPADTFKPSADGKGGPGDGIDIGDILKIIAAAGGAAGAATRKGPSLSSFAGMRGPLNPIFSAQLPAPNMQALSPRSMGGTDWYRYGYGPEQSFFTNVPQGAVNTSTAYTGYDSSAGRTAAAPASFLSSSSYRPLQFSSGLSSASPATAVAAPNGYLPAAEEAAPRVYTPDEIAMYKAMYERTKQASPAPIIPEELSPEATKALLDKAAKSEAIAKRYMKDYGLSEEDLSRLFRGEITSPDLKPVADAFSKEVEDIYGGFANMADATTGDPLRAVERAQDLINQHNQARDWLINAQVSDTSPEWRQQYLDYMSGKTDVPPPGGLSNPDWSWLPAIGKQRGEMGALAGDVVDQWIAASMDPANAEAIAAAKAKQAEMVASGVHGYNSISSRLRNALGGGYAEGGMAEDGLGQTGGGYATGGYAVGGPGDGRDDKIPAMLSDGEYVMDAETVAMLGNGSSKAGAEALDKFRVNLRKHKGRKLSKGEFSVNAKKPEQYLKGRN